MTERTAADCVAEAKALVPILENFAAGCRGSMWQSRDKTIYISDAAARTISDLLAVIEKQRAALRHVADGQEKDYTDNYLIARAALGEKP